jgi:hypothetical protein
MDWISWEKRSRQMPRKVGVIESVRIVVVLARIPCPWACGFVVSVCIPEHRFGQERVATAGVISWLWAYVARFFMDSRGQTNSRADA